MKLRLVAAIYAVQAIVASAHSDGGAWTGASSSPAQQHVFDAADTRHDPALGQGIEWHKALGAGIDGAPRPRPRKVAIVGGGAGGTSAAYFLWRAHEKLREQGQGENGIEVTLLERDERLGGRTAVVHPYFDETMPAIELGASVFADVNMNMRRAAKQFKLTTGAKLGEGAPSVWDGRQFIVENLGEGWWNSAKLFWRYGYSPSTTQTLVSKLVDKFKQLYDADFMHQPSDGNSSLSSSSASSASSSSTSSFASSASDDSDTKSGYPWSSIEDFADALMLRDIANKDAGSHFVSQGVSKLFVEEIIEAATLVNYGQEIFSIHGVGGSVSLAADNARGVDGGNYQIFENFMRQCEQTKIRFGTHGEVTGLARFRTAAEAIKAGKLDSDDARTQHWLNATVDDERHQISNTKWWLGTKSGYGDIFDAVFVAAPWHSSDITLLNTNRVIPNIAYVRLHVTILSTTASQPRPSYFGRGEKDTIPRTILVSHIEKRKAEDEEKRRRDSDKSREETSFRGRRRSYRALWPWGDGGNGKERDIKLDFNSLSYMTSIASPENSNEKEHIVKIFSSEALSDAQLEDIFGQGAVKWTFRKEWDAYPYLTPTMRFPSIEDNDNLFFLNAVEPLMSTMETATISARNAVALYLEREYGSDFVHGGKDCPWQRNVRATDDDDDDLDGTGAWAEWGCHAA